MISRLAGLGAAVFALGATSPASPLRAQDTTQKGVRIGLTYQPGAKPGVLVTAVRGADGDSVRAIIQRDLDYGDRVTIVTGLDSLGGTLNYRLLSTLGAAAVVQPTVTATGVHIAVHDVAAGRVIAVRDYPLASPAQSTAWRLSVHRASDDVERTLTGVQGIAASRVAFVAGGRVQIVDADGWPVATLPDRGTALSPAWAPDGRSIAYSLLGERGTEIVMRTLDGSGARPLPGARGGLNITPAFAADGASLAWAHGEDDGTDIYITGTAGGQAQRVTVGRGTDNVSPTFSPDGRRLAFTSGRSGHPEVYISDADGTNAELLTPYAYGDVSYRSNADWSPDGRAVAFQSQVAGQFQIMTIALRDRSMVRVTTDGSNEDPSWAPDARHIVYTSTRSGTRQLWIVDVESGRTRQLTRTAGARLGAWSRRLGSGSAP